MLGKMLGEMLDRLIRALGDVRGQFVRRPFVLY